MYLTYPFSSDCKYTWTLSYYHHQIDKTDVRPICSCLGLGHDAMVCAVCLSISNSKVWSMYSILAFHVSHRLLHFVKYYHAIRQTHYDWANMFLPYTITNNRLLRKVWPINNVQALQLSQCKQHLVKISHVILRTDGTATAQYFNFSIIKCFNATLAFLSSTVDAIWF